MKIDSPKNPSASVLMPLKRAYNGLKALDGSKGVNRSCGVRAMSEALQDAFDDILEANTLDLETSREMAVPEMIIEWSKLTPERLQQTIQLLQQLAELPDPLDTMSYAPYQLEQKQSYCRRMSLGIITLIYEGFPELGAIAAGLCLKTGNSLILRAGSEGSHCNTIVTQALKIALENADLPPDCVEFISAEQGVSIQELVTQDRYINLVIPYGRPSLVQQVSQLATAPVLRSAMGNCYLYWSPNAELDLVRSIILDSHASVPDPVNAIEKVIVHSAQKPSSLLRLFTSLQEKGFTLKGDAELIAEFPEQLQSVTEAEWRQPYLNKTIAFKVVDRLRDGISWINQYSSGHADCIVTESYQESRRFTTDLDSALVYVNASPRFRRSPKGGNSVFLGISNQKGYRRGLIGLETFTTLQQIVQES